MILNNKAGCTYKGIIAGTDIVGNEVSVTVVVPMLPNEETIRIMVPEQHDCLYDCAVIEFTLGDFSSDGVTRKAVALKHVIFENDQGYPSAAMVQKIMTNAASYEEQEN